MTWFFEKISKIDKTLGRLTKIKEHALKYIIKLELKEEILQLMPHKYKDSNY